MVFTYPLRVRYAECDPQGVVFNANYLVYLDTAITELWREALGGYQRMIDAGLDMVVVKTTLRFHKPARFDELITLEIGVTRLGQTSISTAHEIKREGELLLTASLHHVMVDLGTQSKTEIPKWIRDRLAPWTVVEASGEPDQRD